MTNMFELISDLHKDACGFRLSASFMEAFETQGEAEQHRRWDSLCQELEDREHQEAVMHLDAQRNFERRIEGMVADYNITRSVALQWDMDAFGVDIASALRYYGDATQEIEHYLYCNGLAFQVFSMYVTEIATEIDIYVTEA